MMAGGAAGLCMISFVGCLGVGETTSSGSPTALRNGSTSVDGKVDCSGDDHQSSNDVKAGDSVVVVINDFVDADKVQAGDCDDKDDGDVGDGKDDSGQSGGGKDAGGDAKGEPEERQAATP